MIKLLKVTMSLVMALGIYSPGFAAQANTLAVKAAVPALNGMNITISRVVGTVFTPLTANDTLDFGTLTLDPVNHIFTAPFFFAVDVGVLNNNGTWTLQHTPSSVFNRTTGNTAQNLDNNINVSFMQQVDSTTANPLAKLSFINSTKTITNTDIGTGFLRIFYGIGTGNPASPDNPGVLPIPQNQTAGNYQGSVVLSLTP
ncbi:MAG: hypothetical protein PHN57_01535 [Candidatus Omnitrophica bacterium]|nr:hypothetical protein [Candidatus Omnitrophota bacterium]